MHKKTLFLFCLLLVFFITTIAQPICTGRMLSATDGKIDGICFLRNPNPVGNKTKYTIQSNGVEIYEVEFSYYREADSILIQFYDKQNLTVKREYVKLNPEDSHFLICNYKPNVQGINNDSKSLYEILFGIDNPNKQFITLYQFQAIGGMQTQFILQNVPPVILANHDSAVANYISIIILRREHDSAIARVKRGMIVYKDSIINSIKDKENYKKQQEPTLNADAVLQRKFKARLDTFFINYYKNIYTFNNEDFDVDFNFNSDGYGKIKVDSIRGIHFKNGVEQRNWLKDSFMLKIKPQIEKITYETLTSTYTNINLDSDFYYFSKSNLRLYKNLGEKDTTEFAELKKQINDELNSYSTRNINVPTKYSYTFKYNSAVKTPTWKYEARNDKFIDKSDKENRVEITENLKQIFRNKYAHMGSNKYTLKVCTLNINNTLMGQDIQLIKTK